MNSANSNRFIFGNLHTEDLSVNDGFGRETLPFDGFSNLGIGNSGKHKHAVPFVLFHLVSPLNMFETWPEIIERTKSRIF